MQLTLSPSCIAFRLLVGGFVTLVTVVLPCFGEGESQTPVDFNKHIRPILSDACFTCHGPDEDARQAELRLDHRDSAIADRGGYVAVAPGDASSSELVQRITSSDEALVMPPPESKRSLTAAEVLLLQRWIDEGAVYSKHWAFVPPERPPLPDLDAEGDRWVRNPIDSFIFRKLQSEGMVPSERADRATLVRRMHLDLTGLPPTLEEQDTFLNDNSSTAFRTKVEQLLASPHYGERWGRHWLDAARYSDSDGYEKDMRRSNWFYRDWVINAVNEDKPYDEFIIEQIAGDMLPGAGQDELVATGFLRNSMVNEEGGADPEQFRVEAIFDRMDAIGKAVLGITTQCAQCHTHKYDPLTHNDYYGMFAFLNSCYESNITVYTADEQQQIRSIQQDIARVEQQLRESRPNWKEELIAWAKSERQPKSAWQVLHTQRYNFTGQKFSFLDDGSIVSRSYAPPNQVNDFVVDSPVGRVTGFRFELLLHPDLPHGGPGRSIYGTNALTEFEVALLKDDGQEQTLKFASAASDINVKERPIAFPFIDDRQGPEKRIVGPIHFAIDSDDKTGWTTNSGPATRNQPRKAVFVLDEPLELEGGTRLILRLKQNHGGQLGNQRHSNIAGHFRFSITDASAPEIDLLPEDVRQIVSRKVDTWAANDWDRLFSYWRTTQSDWDSSNSQINELLAAYPAGRSQYVVSPLPTPRNTYRMDRGDFLSPAEEVEPHTPDFLHPFDSSLSRNRLGFARWLVDRRSPTTARALVNRVWQHYFGKGLVETTEDLGSQSPQPSHPELLDWLAVEFMESGWSLKHLHKLIINSATYQQLSTSSEEDRKIDPYNRLLARGPRVRVQAEIVRDIALAASGLLNPNLGGPTVYPPAPAFIFLPPASYGVKQWETANGPADYRRSVYVQAYRSAQYPTMQAFDAPNGNTSCVRRNRSNTPLQALTVLNEQQYMECAQALSQRLLQSTSAGDAERIETAFRLLLSRTPTDDEMTTLNTFLDQCRRDIGTQGNQASKIAGFSNSESDSDAKEAAVWTLLARCLLNLDETITKQ